MTSEEKMRGDFEAWHKAMYSYLPRYDIAHDYYLDSECDDRYDTWKASRESLVIELPEAMECDDGYPTDDWLESNAQKRMLNICRESIHAAGVKTK